MVTKSPAPRERISQASSETSPQDMPAMTVSSRTAPLRGAPARALARRQAARSDSTTTTRGRRAPSALQNDRKSVVEGTSVSVRVDLGGRRIIKTKNLLKNHNKAII